MNKVVRASVLIVGGSASHCAAFAAALPPGARSDMRKQFTPTDPAGVVKIAPISMTHDATSYAYDALRTVNDLYVAEGLQ